jgi:hypothetical protein
MMEQYLTEHTDRGSDTMGIYTRISTETSLTTSCIYNMDPITTRLEDIPCTISLQWLLRWDKLHCTVNMRSSDAWLGLPYDYFTFSQLTNVLASRLRVPVGTITMNLASSHLYEENWHEAVSVCVGNVGYLSSPPIPYGVQLPTKVDTIMMLNQVQREYPNSFHLYAKALKRSKIKALEVLRAIDPFKQKGLLSSDVETSGS